MRIDRAGRAATVALRANRGVLSQLVRLCAAAVLLAGGPVIALAQAPQLPKSPITINVVDVAGDLALTQGAIEAYQAKHPNLVAKVNFTKAPAPELPAKLQAMQSAGRSDIDLVLTGVVALSAGIDQGLWVKMLPDHAASLGYQGVPMIVDDDGECVGVSAKVRFDQQTVALSRRLVGRRVVTAP